MIFGRGISRAVSLRVLNVGEAGKVLDDKMGKPKQGKANNFGTRRTRGGAGLLQRVWGFVQRVQPYV